MAERFGFSSEEDLNSLRDIDHKLNMFALSQSQSDGCSDIDSITTIGQSNMGSLRSVVSRWNKTTGIDYLREQREERLYRENMKQINEALAKLHQDGMMQEQIPRLSEDRLRQLIEEARLTM